MDDLVGLAEKSRVFDLAQPYFVGMPHFPTHPPFLYGLTKKHGDFVLPAGGSSAAESIALGGHVGTHIDALCHFSCGGKLYGGIEAEAVQSYGGGVRKLSVDTVAPIVRRGILLDIAALHGAPLPADFVITPQDMEAALWKQGTACREGDVVLLRTGWARYWENQALYLHAGSGSAVAGPGPEIDGARWLTGRKIFAAGSDTIAFERMPSRDMEVHVHLLVQSGVHILEALNLEELAAESVYEFLLIAAPLKIRGGTGAPIRPLALAPRES
ncbi:MAG TPA: cyclase family protein [Bryobacteraceae bacterium]|jgi:kynurenine formamidase|nr:cyclase family protein [Bryobacteraceae bacterium]